MKAESVVIVGAGQAGQQTAVSLRQDGFTGSITLIGEEPELPYQRPPLSKGFLQGKVNRDGLQLRSRKFYDDHAIQIIHDRITAIDRTTDRVLLAEGSSVPYGHLVLAVGAHNRGLAIPGAELQGVVGLRTLADAETLMTHLLGARQVVVAGAGFIGLEFAAQAAARGIVVHVLELADRPMSRAVTHETAAVFRDAHVAAGVKFGFREGVTAAHGRDGRVVAVETSQGRIIDADVLVVGVGVLPNIALAAEAGLQISNGVRVDAYLVSSDPRISAIGDCASFPSQHAGEHARLESVQNAIDQARCVAARLTGRPAPYAALPWFWSDQGALKLQIAGLPLGVSSTIVVGDVAQKDFSVLCFRGEQLVAVESVNRAGDHMAARKLIARQSTLTPRDAAKPGFDLRAFEHDTR